VGKDSKHTFMLLQFVFGHSVMCTYTHINHNFGGWSDWQEFWYILHYSLVCYCFAYIQL